MQAADLSLTAKAKQRQHARNCRPFAVQARVERCLRKRQSGSNIGDCEVWGCATNRPTTASRCANRLLRPWTQVGLRRRAPSNSSPATQTELAKDTTPNITSPLLARVGTLQPKFFGLAEAVGCCASRSGWRIDPGPEERPKINCGVRLRCCHPFLKRAASGILSPILRQLEECIVTDHIA
jgi:hypothetical protein